MFDLTKLFDTVTKCFSDFNQLTFLVALKLTWYMLRKPLSINENIT